MVFRFLLRMGRLLVGIVLAVALTSSIGMSPLSTVLERLGIQGGTAQVTSGIGVSPLSAAPVAAKSGHTSSTSSLSLVLLNSTDGLPHWGQDVTFNVSTTATNSPYVSLDCYQNGVLVYGAMTGFFPSYPWPNETFPLSSPSWTSGAASCTATLYYFNGRKDITLATLKFQVYA